MDYWGASDYEFIQQLLYVLLGILSKKYRGKDIKKLHIEKGYLAKNMRNDHAIYNTRHEFW